MQDNHIEVNAPDEATYERMAERMYAYIFPNVPQTDEEKDAFEQAVLWQYAHDCTKLSEMGSVPVGAASFKIGDFSMAFDKGVLDDQLNRRNICPSVYGLLLRHGLLYRGVEGRLPYALD